jgi:predicted P-loop ATPase
MPDVEEALQKELDQAKAGIHQRQKSEEKRLVAVKAAKLKRADQRRQLRVGVVDARFEEQRREVCANVR